MIGDDDFDDDSVGAEPLTAHVAGSGDGALGDLLLELITAVVRLNVLLGEADESEFRAARGRLGTLRKAMDELPTEPRARRRVGFKTPQKRKRKR